MQTVKAGTLLYALIMTLMMSAVSGSLLLFGYYSRLEFDLIYEKERLLLNVNSGVNLLLADEYQIIKDNEPAMIDLFGSGRDSVLLEKRSYGALEVIRSRATFRNISESKIALIGSSLTYKGDTNIALFLYDNNRPLSLCGNTLIKGDCYLPEEGVKRAYVEGQSFSGSKLVNGIIKKSGKDFPLFNKLLFENISRLQKSEFSKYDSVIGLQAINNMDTVINSFENKPLIIFSKGEIVIEDFKKISGNIILVSGTMIRVNPLAILQDVICIAPIINIREQFEGSLQAFASDSLIIELGCKLNYPSVAGIVKQNSSMKTPVLILQDSVEVYGALFAFSSNEDPQRGPGIISGKNTIIHGEIYSNGWVDFKGTLHGMMIAKKIMLSTPSSVYENHLLNTTIDRSELPGFFAGVSLTGEINEKQIAKWLD